MALVEYHSSILKLDVLTTTKRVDRIESYPNGYYSPPVYTYKTSTTTSVTKDGSRTRHKSRDSVGTPNFRNLVSRGLPLPFNTYTFSLHENDDWVGTYATRSVPNVYGTSTEQYRSGSWSRPNSPRLVEGREVPGCAGLMSAGDRSAVHARAVMKVITRIRNQKVDLGVAMGEHKRTVSMVAKNATRIAGALLALKRGDFAAAANQFGTGLPTRARRRFDRDFVNRNRPRAIGSAWLELQYGWKPLLNDIYGSCQQLAEQPRKVYQQCSGDASYTSAISGTYDVSANSKTVEFGTHKYSEKIIVRFATSNTAVQDMGRLGLLNPLTIAWELMPYSFVIDWFLPIGNWLASFNYDAGLSFLEGSVTTFDERKSSAILTNFGSDTSWRYDGSRQKTSKQVAISRTKLTSFPSVPYPSFKNPASVGHMLNALALLSNLRK